MVHCQYIDNRKLEGGVLPPRSGGRCRKAAQLPRSGPTTCPGSRGTLTLGASTASPRSVTGGPQALYTGRASFVPWQRQRLGDSHHFKIRSYDLKMQCHLFAQHPEDVLNPV